MTRGAEPFNFDGMHTAYPALRDHIISGGTSVSPRGEETLEILGMSFSVRDAVNRGVPLGCGRKVGRAMQTIDGVTLLSGYSYHDVNIRLAKTMDRFGDVFPGNDSPVAPDGTALTDAEYDELGRRHPDLEGGERFQQGAYGPRIGDQLEKVEKQLRSDKLTRQAVVSLWSETDRNASWHDRPCVTEFQLMIRDGKLDIFVFMRANDLFTGTAYDVFSMAQIQAAMAHVLGVSYGTYHHYATSIHIYQRDMDRISEIGHWPSSTEPFLENPREDWGPNWDGLEPGTYKSWPEVRKAFTAILEAARHGLRYTPSNPVEEWYWARYEKMRADE